MSQTDWIVLIAANIPTYFVIGTFFFKDIYEFLIAFLTGISPKRTSILSKNLRQDNIARLKLGLWLIICIACVLVEALIIKLVG